MLDKEQKKCGESMEKEVIMKTKETPKEISKPEDFTAPSELYDKLIESVRRYHPSTDISAIEKAYRIADMAHEGQKRKSGEPYIIHPLCVGIILE